jgi:hypothetical protein
MLACDDASVGRFDQGSQGDGTVDMARATDMADARAMDARSTDARTVDGGQPDARGTDAAATPDAVTALDAAATTDAAADMTSTDGFAAEDAAVPPEPCGEGETRPCSDGCATQQACSGGVWLPCVLPSETCNDLDDDCDGQTDEAFPDVGEQCNAGMGACRAEGVVICNAGGDAAVCNAIPRAGEPELCNALDDDCDGRTDENIPPVACYSGPAGTQAVGLCRGGMAACVEGEPGACMGEVLPGDEVCANGQDEDCDGRADEGCVCNDGDTQPCGNDVGLCRRGIQHCANNAYGPCEGETGPVAEACNGEDDDCDGRTDEGTLNACGACGLVPAEVCNGADDDCDGSTDEGFGIGEACSEGVGACRRDGVVTCPAANGDFCSVTPGEPIGELCNAQDDDCDGQADEGVVRPCGSEVGSCRPGTEVCTNGQFGACMGAVGPEMETCNEGDDDCDGRVDEGFNLQNDPNNCGACGRVCQRARVVSTACEAGDCVPDCQDRWLNVSGDPADGCPCPTPAPDGPFVDNIGESYPRFDNQARNVTFRGDGTPGFVAWHDDVRDGAGLQVWRTRLPLDGFSFGWPEVWFTPAAGQMEGTLDIEPIPTGGYRINRSAVDEQGNPLAGVNFQGDSPYAWDSIRRRFVGLTVTHDNQIWALGERRTAWDWNNVARGARIHKGVCPPSSGRCFFVYERLSDPLRLWVIAFQADGAAQANANAEVAPNAVFRKLIAAQNDQFILLFSRLGNEAEMFRAEIDSTGAPHGAITPIPIVPTDDIIQRGNELVFFHPRPIGQDGRDTRPYATWYDLDLQPTGREVHLEYNCRPNGWASDDVVHCSEGALVSMATGRLIGKPSYPLNGNSIPLVAAGNRETHCLAWMGGNGGVWMGQRGGEPTHVAVAEQFTPGFAGLTLPDQTAAVVSSWGSDLVATQMGSDCTGRGQHVQQLMWLDGVRILSSLQLQVAATAIDEGRMLVGYLGGDGGRRGIGASVVTLDGSPMSVATLAERPFEVEESTIAIAGPGGDVGWSMLTRLRGAAPAIRMRSLTVVEGPEGSVVEVGAPGIFELPTAHVFGPSVVALTHPENRHSLIAWIDKAPGSCDGLAGGNELWIQVRDDGFGDRDGSLQVPIDLANGCPRELRGTVLPEGFTLSWGTEIPNGNPRWGLWAQTFSKQGRPIGAPFQIPGALPDDGIHTIHAVDGQVRIAWLERSQVNQRDQAALVSTTLGCGQ